MTIYGNMTIYGSVSKYGFSSFRGFLLFTLMVGLIAKSLTAFASLYQAILAFKTSCRVSIFIMFYTLYMVVLLWQHYHIWYFIKVFAYGTLRACIVRFQI